MSSCHNRDRAAKQPRAGMQSTGEGWYCGEEAGPLLGEGRGRWVGGRQNNACSQCKFTGQWQQCNSTHLCRSVDIEVTQNRGLPPS